MSSIQKFDCLSSIGVLLIKNDKIYTGSYDFASNRIGCIQMYSIDMEHLCTINTPGILDLKTDEKYLYASTASSIIKYTLDLHKIKEVQTNYMNTYMTIYNSHLYVCTSTGYIYVYSTYLSLEYTIKVSKDILWTCVVTKDTIICGGECSTLFYIKDKQIIHTMQIGQRITSLLIDDDYLLLGSYDEHIYKIKNAKIEDKIFIGGGVWRINKHNNKFYLACMYNGIKLCDKNFHSCTQFFKETNDIQEKDQLIYALDTNENFLFTSTFYGHKIYKIKI